MSEEKETFTPPPLKHKNIQYVKNIRTSRVMIATPELAKRGDMVPCTSNGQLLNGHVGDAGADTKAVRKSKYIGFMAGEKPGRLFIYSEQLAAKPGAIPVDDPAEWGGDTSNVVALVQPDATEKKPDGVNPVLSRSGDQPETADSPEPGVTDQPETADSSETESQEPVTDAGNFVVEPIPDISGIEDEKEAKDLLKAWAMANFEVQLDGRLGVQKMLSECEAMIAPPADQQAAG